MLIAEPELDIEDGVADIVILPQADQLLCLWLRQSHYSLLPTIQQFLRVTM